MTAAQADALITICQNAEFAADLGVGLLLCIVCALAMNKPKG